MASSLVLGNTKHLNRLVYIEHGHNLYLKGHDGADGFLKKSSKISLTLPVMRIVNALCDITSNMLLKYY